MCFARSNGVFTLSLFSCSAACRMAAESLCQTVAVFGAGLLENVVRVRLDRPLRNAKLRADFPVVLSLKQQREHVLLSGAQRNAPAISADGVRRGRRWNDGRFRAFLFLKELLGGEAYGSA